MKRRNMIAALGALLGLPFAWLGKGKTLKPIASATRTGLPDDRRTMQPKIHIVDETLGLEWDAIYRVVPAQHGVNIEIIDSIEPFNVKELW